MNVIVRVWVFLYFFTTQNSKYWIRGSVLLCWIYVNRTVFHTVKRELFKLYFYVPNFNGLPDYLEGLNHIKNSDLLPCLGQVSSFFSLMGEKKEYSNNKIVIY